MFFKARPKTVDAAIAPLLQAITDLEGVADARNEALARNSELISSLEVRKIVDQLELTRAEAVSKMIRVITSPVSETSSFEDFRADLT